MEHPVLEPRGRIGHPALAIDQARGKRSPDLEILHMHPQGYARAARHAQRHRGCDHGRSHGKHEIGFEIAPRAASGGIGAAGETRVMRHSLFARGIRRNVVRATGYLDPVFLARLPTPLEAREELPFGIIGLAHDRLYRVAAFHQRFGKAGGIGPDADWLGSVIQPDEEDTARGHQG